MTTFVDTKQCARAAAGGGHGEFAEIVNEQLCGAKDVLAMLRWLKSGESFTAEPKAGTHQLVYFMDGDGTITLDNQSHDVPKGGGIYLGPDETASVAPQRAGELKLLHLVVPKIEGR
jgi:glyoxylate utilization-related uncharacterized protein